MKIRILGGGFYGCHIASMLIKDGHCIELHEIADKLFSGASGNIPARLHCGSHYPRSKLTRIACRSHYKEFMDNYGHLTRHVPVNLYCIAAYDRLLDFGTYCDILRNDIEFITVSDTSEFGLENVEGAILTGERHILVDVARDYFYERLKDHVKFGILPDQGGDDFDLTVDCTFCARDEQDIDRFEVCLTVLLEGPTDKAVTVMDGPFPSLYPWDEERGICSLTSAEWTPIEKRNNWLDAREILNNIPPEIVNYNAEQMIRQMSFYYPGIENYRLIDTRLAIRAMPRSGCDARLVDVIYHSLIGNLRHHRTIRVRAGKIDAIFYAYDEIINIIDRIKI